MMKVMTIVVIMPKLFSIIELFLLLIQARGNPIKPIPIPHIGRNDKIPRTNSAV